MLAEMYASVPLWQRVNIFDLMSYLPLGVVICRAITSFGLFQISLPGKTVSIYFLEPFDLMIEHDYLNQIHVPSSSVYKIVGYQIRWDNHVSCFHYIQLVVASRRVSLKQHTFFPSRICQRAICIASLKEDSNATPNMVKLRETKQTTSNSLPCSEFVCIIFLLFIHIF